MYPLLTCLLFIPYHLFGQTEVAFESNLPIRLYILDSIFNKPDPLKTDPALLTQKADQIKALAIQYHDIQSQLLSDIYYIRITDIIQSRSNEKSDKDLLEPSVNKIHGIIQTAIENQYVYLQVHAFINLAEIMRVHKRPGATLVYNLKAYEVLSGTDAKGFPDVYLLAKKIGSNFYELGDYTKAKLYIEKAISPETYPIAVRNNVLPRKRQFNMLNYDLLSQIHLKLGHYDTSRLYIEKGMKIYEQEDTMLVHFKGWRGIFQGNLGKIYYYQQDYIHAIPLFKLAMKITEDAQLYDNVSAFGLLLADCYLKSGKVSEVKSLLHPLQITINFCHQNPFLNRNSERLYIDFFKLLLTVPGNNYSLVRKQQLLDSIGYWTIKLNERMDLNAQIKNEMEFEIANFKKSEDILQQNIRRQKAYRNTLWGFLGLIILSAVFLLNRKQLQIKLKQKEAMFIKEGAEKQLDLARAQLNAFKTTLIEKSKKIEILEANQDMTQSNIILENLRSSTILSNEEWTKFKQIFEQAYPDYLARLHQRFKGLTDGETRFIVLIKLALNNKEMASTLGVSAGAMRTMKSRLIKKIQLSEMDSFEEIVNAI